MLAYKNSFGASLPWNQNVLHTQIFLECFIGAKLPIHRCMDNYIHMEPHLVVGLAQCLFHICKWSPDMNQEMVGLSQFCFTWYDLEMRGQRPGIFFITNDISFAAVGFDGTETEHASWSILDCCGTQINLG